jgi:hypothetical protein
MQNELGPTREQLLRIVEALLKVRKQEFEYRDALDRGDLVRAQQLIDSSQPARDAIDEALEEAGFND